jgi:hypothetical protein
VAGRVNPSPWNCGTPAPDRSSRNCTRGSKAASPLLIHASGDPFQGSYRDIQSVTLKKQATGWKLTNMPYPFWDYSWYQPEIKK